MELNEDIKQQALQLNIKLDKDTLVIIKILENFYNLYNHVPNRRAFANFAKPILVQNNLDTELVSSINLIKKFGDTPLKNMAKIANLPEPENCL